MSGNHSLPSPEPIATVADLPVVMQIVPLLAGGGIARAAVDVAAAIVAAGGRTIIASAGGHMTADLQRLRVPHIELPLDQESIFAGYGLVRKLAASAQEHRVGIVHARSRYTAWLTLGVARRLRASSVASVHWPLRGDGIVARRYEAAYGRMDRLIAVSSFIAGDIAAHVPSAAGRTVEIAPGISLDRFNPATIRADRLIRLAARLRLPDDRKIVLFPARLVEDRGQLALIDAIKALGRDDVFCLLLGGSTPRTSFEAVVEQRVEAAGLGGTVQIGEFCDDMPAAYMLADVVVAAGGPAQGFSRALIEAQAMSRPVVATAGDGREEGFVAGRTGWTVAAGDTPALAEAISRALDLDTQQRAVLSTAATEHVRRHFGLPLMASRTLALYRELAVARLPQA